MTRHAVIVTALGAIFSVNAAWAETSTFEPEADAHIYMGSPDENYGRSAFLRARNNPVSAMKTYIRFDISDIGDPLTITAATLQLAAYADGAWLDQSFHVYGLSDGHEGETWVEGDSGKTSADGLTWSNAPANDHANPTGFTADAVSLGFFTPEAGAKGYQAFTSEEFVAFLRGDTNGKVTLMIATDGRGIQSIDARTRPTPPRLEITHGE